ncbi:MAG: hypothetical protein U1G07_03590 [Verrucomicrobiota bacterium]
MTPAAALILLVLLCVVLAGTRRQALIALICGVLYVSQAQAINVLGVNFFGVRFLEVGAIARVLSRREFFFSNLNTVDRGVLWLYGYTTVVFLLRSPDGLGSAVAIALDAGFAYFTFRALLQTMEDLRWLLRIFVVVLVPLMLLLVVERKTGQIPLSFMAGSAGYEGHFVREGVPRCFGSFRNMDLLGTVGSSFLPLYIALVLSKVDRSRAVLGVIFCLSIVVFSNSGGPIGCVGVAFFGWALWLFRTRMRLFRWGVVAFFAVLAMIMKAPIWYFLDRVSSVTGGAGWHRSYLIDVAVQHLRTWWLMGVPIGNTREWFPYTIDVTGGADITNQYLLFGITGGLGAMSLLIVLVTRAFSWLGRSLAIARAGGPPFRRLEMMLWGLGVMLGVHVVNWFGITYYDQFYMIWFLQLAAISTLAGNVLQGPLVRRLQHLSRTRDSDGQAALNSRFAV